MHNFVKVLLLGTVLVSAVGAWAEAVSDAYRQFTASDGHQYYYNIHTQSAHHINADGSVGSFVGRMSYYNGRKLSFGLANGERVSLVGKFSPVKIPATKPAPAASPAKPASAPATTTTLYEQGGKYYTNVKNISAEGAGATKSEAVKRYGADAVTGAYSVDASAGVVSQNGKNVGVVSNLAGGDTTSVKPSSTPLLGVDVRPDGVSRNAVPTMVQSAPASPAKRAAGLPIWAQPSSSVTSGSSASSPSSSSSSSSSSSQGSGTLKAGSIIITENLPVSKPQSQSVAPAATPTTPAISATGGAQQQLQTVYGKASGWLTRDKALTLDTNGNAFYKGEYFGTAVKGSDGSYTVTHGSDKYTLQTSKTNTATPSFVSSGASNAASTTLSNPATFSGTKNINGKTVTFNNGVGQSGGTTYKLNSDGTTATAMVAGTNKTTTVGVSAGEKTTNVNWVISDVLSSAQNKQNAINQAKMTGGTANVTHADGSTTYYRGDGSYYTVSKTGVRQDFNANNERIAVSGVAGASGGAGYGVNATADGTQATVNAATVGGKGNTVAVATGSANGQGANTAYGIGIGGTAVSGNSSATAKGIQQGMSVGRDGVAGNMTQTFENGTATQSKSAVSGNTITGGITETSPDGVSRKTNLPSGTKKGDTIGGVTPLAGNGVSSAPAPTNVPTGGRDVVIDGVGYTTVVRDGVEGVMSGRRSSTFKPLSDFKNVSLNTTGDMVINGQVVHFERGEATVGNTKYTLNADGLTATASDKLFNGREVNPRVVGVVEKTGDVASFNEFRMSSAVPNTHENRVTEAARQAATQNKIVALVTAEGTMYVQPDGTSMLVGNNGEKRYFDAKGNAVKDTDWKVGSGKTEATFQAGAQDGKAYVEGQAKAPSDTGKGDDVATISAGADKNRAAVGATAEAPTEDGGSFVVKDAALGADVDAEGKPLEQPVVEQVQRGIEKDAAGKKKAEIVGVGTVDENGVIDQQQAAMVPDEDGNPVFSADETKTGPNGVVHNKDDSPEGFPAVDKNAQNVESSVDATLTGIATGAGVTPQNIAPQFASTDLNKHNIDMLGFDTVFGKETSSLNPFSDWKQPKFDADKGTIKYTNDTQQQKLLDVHGVTVNENGKVVSNGSKWGDATIKAMDSLNYWDGHLLDLKNASKDVRTAQSNVDKLQKAYEKANSKIKAAGEDGGKSRKKAVEAKQKLEAAEKELEEARQKKADAEAKTKADIATVQAVEKAQKERALDYIPQKPNGSTTDPNAGQLLGNIMDGYKAAIEAGDYDAADAAVDSALSQGLINQDTANNMKDATTGARNAQGQAGKMAEQAEVNSADPATKVGSVDLTDPIRLALMILTPMLAEDHLSLRDDINIKAGDIGPAVGAVDSTALGTDQGEDASRATTVVGGAQLVTQLLQQAAVDLSLLSEDVKFEEEATEEKPANVGTTDISSTGGQQESYREEQQADTTNDEVAEEDSGDDALSEAKRQEIERRRAELMKQYINAGIQIAEGMNAISSDFSARADQIGKFSEGVQTESAGYGLAQDVGRYVLFETLRGLALSSTQMGVQASRLLFEQEVTDVK